MFEGQNKSDYKQMLKFGEMLFVKVCDKIFPLLRMDWVVQVQFPDIIAQGQLEALPPTLSVIRLDSNQFHGILGGVHLLRLLWGRVMLPHISKQICSGFPLLAGFKLVGRKGVGFLVGLKPSFIEDLVRCQKYLAQCPPSGAWPRSFHCS